MKVQIHRERNVFWKTLINRVQARGKEFENVFHSYAACLWFTESSTKMRRILMHIRLSTKVNKISKTMKRFVDTPAEVNCCMLFTSVIRTVFYFWECDIRNAAFRAGRRNRNQRWINDSIFRLFLLKLLHSDMVMKIVVECKSGEGHEIYWIP